MSRDLCPPLDEPTPVGMVYCRRCGTLAASLRQCVVCRAIACGDCILAHVQCDHPMEANVVLLEALTDELDPTDFKERADG